MLIKVLGSAAGGGFPQWNCRCPVCMLAWSKDPRVRPRSQSSIAVTANGADWLLVNASPDLRQQICETPALQPKHGLRHSPIAAVMLTNGDIDHIAGLLTLREQQRFDLFASWATLGHMAGNPLFRVLNPDLVRRREMQLSQHMEFEFGLSVVPFAVPGKAPLYDEGDVAQIGEESGSTIGLELSSGNAHAFYIPGCARITDELAQRIKGAGALLFDGTTYTDDEMVRLGLSHKTAWRMGHLPMSGPQGSMARLADVAVDRKIFIHINNSNPVLVDGSPERLTVEAAGWEIAHDGMEIAL